MTQDGARVAKLFMNGGSQAVRLPIGFRFEGDEVYVRRDPLSGDVIISRKSRPFESWAEFFELRNAADVASDFLESRPGNEPLGLRDMLGDAP